jgi:hypothetical protein
LNRRATVPARAAFRVYREADHGGRLFLAGSRLPQTTASETHDPEEVGANVGQLWRILTGGFGSIRVDRLFKLTAD